MVVTYRCEKCNSDLKLQSELGKAPEAPNCPTCNELMKRVFRVGKGSSLEADMCDIGRKMSYHSSKTIK